MTPLDLAALKAAQKEVLAAAHDLRRAMISQGLWKEADAAAHDLRRAMISQGLWKEADELSDSLRKVEDFDENGKKHNDAGGGYTWNKCYCKAGEARATLERSK